MHPKGSCLAILLAVVFCFPVLARAQITGTDHDFSFQGYSGGEICIVCHTPHGADTTVVDAPLWNHELTTQVYELYSSATLDAVLSQPDGPSKLCLSCHDGTVAIDSFGGRTGTSFVSPGKQVGGDGSLADEHPISFTYDSELATTDGGLFDPLVRSSGLGGTINDDMLFNARVECSSCHDVHGAGFPAFLIKSNDGSDLCLTCHDK